jgi:hypothetical protein
VRHDVQPRIHRHFKYAFIRASTTTIMQEASTFMLISDMFRGVPAVYNTFFAYDEVAHHSGIDRPDAFKVLRTLDAVFATLEQAATMAPRPYHLVVLSDHGQSMGATFRQRYDMTLPDLVDQLIASDAPVQGFESVSEGTGNLNLALTEATRQGGWVGSSVTRLTRGHTSDQDVALGSEEEMRERASVPEAAGSGAVVLASGNLGLISFPAWPERMTLEQITGAFPGLVPGLVAHDGIGFIMVRSERDGGVVIGRDGRYYLDSGRVEGTNPLAPFEPNAATHLKRTDGFRNAPDILVNSFIDPETGEVAAFEELVGCHGGLGGTQTQPFVLSPVALPLPGEPIVGAAALHRVLKGWRGDIQASPSLPT